MRARISTPWWVIVFATIGPTVHATINYLAGYYLGRPLIYRFANSRLGRLCLLTQEKVEKSERYFDNHGMVATITGRLIPGIRHLISIPAGLARMNYWKFLLYTTIGAGCLARHPGAPRLVSLHDHRAQRAGGQDHGV